MPFFSYQGKVFKANNKYFKTDWKPNRVNGIVFWGDSNSRNINITNNKIYEWNDSSGNLNNATQTNDNRKPSYIDDTLNGYPVIYFQNTKSLKIPLTLDYFTIFTVIKAFDNDIVYEFGDDTETESGFYLNGQINSLGVSNSGLSNIASVKQNTNGWLSSGGTWKIIAHQYNGTHNTHRMIINNEFVFTTTYLGYNGDPGALDMTDNLNLGSKSDGTEGVDAYIAEYIVYNNYLNYDNVSQITNYLNTKYQIF